MSEPQRYKLDDKYKDGIWYDLYNGDFCEIQMHPDKSIVELVNPENKNVYWDMPLHKWVEREKQDFRQVPEEAVDDPVNVVNQAIRKLTRNDSNELMSVGQDFAIKLMYARDQIEINEI
jgi:hypothetical protein